MRKPLMVIGVALLMLAMLGLLVRAITAATEGLAFMGRSFYALPVSTYVVLSVFAVAVIVATIVLVRKCVAWIERAAGKLGS